MPDFSPAKQNRALDVTRWPRGGALPYEMLAVDMNAERPIADPFERLFVAEYPRVRAVARRVLGDANLAEDVAQDVFAAFHRSQRADAPYAAAWLHAAAVHTALNVLRGNRRRLGREEREARATESLRTGDERHSDPQAHLESEERRREVRDALRRLPIKKASVLALRYGGLTYAEVAAALNVGINQVGTLLARAEAAFKKEIDRVAPR
jgi:RNA polymerase sigma factor (sigma-70 family)